jgi:ubiquitin carboxyl-terminal hydrolase 7
VKITQITPLVNREIALEQLAHEQLLDGDIYVFQINEKEKLQTYKNPLVIDYFSHLCLQVEILFCDKNNPNDEGFTLLLSLKMKYDEFAKLVAAHINHDFMHIQFLRTTNSYDMKATVGTAIKYNQDFQLKDAFNLNTKQAVRKLFYSKLTMNIIELDERRQFKVTWLSSNLKNEKELTLMPHKKATVKDLLAECRTELLNEEVITKQQFEDTTGFKLRLDEIVGSKIHRVFKCETSIESLDPQQANKNYRMEQILSEEENLVEGECLLPVAHFSKEIYATFGTPFLLKIRLGEPFRDIKARIQKRLEVLDKEFLTYRFAVISMGTANYVSEEENTIFDLSGSTGYNPWLGIDHPNKNANKTKNRYSTMEKAIKIFN